MTTPPGGDVPRSEFLVYSGPAGGPQVQVRLEEGTVWLSQRLLAELYGVTVPTINEHLEAIYSEGEVDPGPTIRKFRIVQTEGKREVTRLIEHYALPAILAVGFRVRSPQGTLFRKWATETLDAYLAKGFVLDDARLKDGHGLGADYFDELLARIRDIRASERRFYQKLTDIFAQCSIDYTRESEFARSFYATVQNKLHFAVHGHTAAEVIRDRANASLPHMGLKTWKNAPDGAIRKPDVSVAKNYLDEEELTELNRVVTMYLDYAEDQARGRRPMTMADWKRKLDEFLAFYERGVLPDAGKVSHQLAQLHAEGQFEQFEAKRRQIEASQPTSDFDRFVTESKQLEASRKSGTSPKRRGPGKK